MRRRGIFCFVCLFVGVGTVLRMKGSLVVVVEMEN